MKDLSYSMFLGMATGQVLGWSIRSAVYWDATAWAIILAMSLFIYCVWKIDTWDDVD